MAGLRGNEAYMVSAAQSEGKGKFTKKWANKNFFAGNSRIEPTEVIGKLAETDATRQDGINYVQQTAVSGSPTVYVREDSIHDFLYYVLGGKADSGTAGEYKHILTPSATIPYCSFGTALGSTLFEQYQDCMVSDLAISAATGSPLQASATVQGLSATRLAAEWSAELAPPAASALAPFNMNQAVVKLGGVQTHLISSFNATISNSVTLQQTDNSVPFDVVPGLFTVTMGFDLIFENLIEYNKFHYGGESGTTQSAELYTTSAEFEFSFSAKRYLKFAFPKLAYQAFPVNPDTSGAPIVVSVTAAAQRSAEPFTTATVGNAVEKTL